MAPLGGKAWEGKPSSAGRMSRQAALALISAMSEAPDKLPQLRTPLLLKYTLVHS